LGNELDATSSLGPSTNLSDEMVRHILLRQRIQFEILSGNVHEATDLLNRYFPRVLAVDDSGESSSETEVADENAGDPSRLEYVAETVNPVHLSLNLRILAFIEACRTVPLVYPGPLPSERGSAGGRSPVSFPDSDSDIVMVATPSSAAAKHDTREEESYQAELLICVQKLYATVNALGKSEDRAIYLKELSNVGGLLAYAVPENSPMVKYLHQERRDRVAEQINSAILHHTHMPSVSYLERAVRYTHCLWGMLHELRAKVPAAHRPRGVSLLLGTGSQGAREPDKETFYEARPFDLQLLLNTRT